MEQMNELEKAKLTTQQNAIDYLKKTIPAFWGKFGDRYSLNIFDHRLGYSVIHYRLTPNTDYLFDFELDFNSSTPNITVVQLAVDKDSQKRVVINIHSDEEILAYLKRWQEKRLSIPNYVQVVHQGRRIEAVFCLNGDMASAQAHFGDRLLVDDSSNGPLKIGLPLGGNILIPPATSFWLIHYDFPRELGFDDFSKEFVFDVMSDGQFIRKFISKETQPQSLSEEIAKSLAGIKAYSKI